MERDIDRIYKAFLEIVGKARTMAPEDVHPVAAGRVWTGRQALERKLVDELGGLEEGVRKARALAGLKDTAPLREPRPPKRGIPPLATATAGGWFGYLAEGLSLLGRAPALAVMEYFPGKLP